MASLHLSFTLNEVLGSHLYLLTKKLGHDNTVRLLQCLYDKSLYRNIVLCSQCLLDPERYLSQ